MLDRNCLSEILKIRSSNRIENSIIDMLSHQSTYFLIKHLHLKSIAQWRTAIRSIQVLTETNDLWFSQLLTHPYNNTKLNIEYNIKRTTTKNEASTYQLDSNFFTTLDINPCRRNQTKTLQIKPTKRNPTTPKIYIHKKKKKKSFS